MVSTKIVIFYIFFVLFFNFLVGGFALSDEDNNIDLDKSLLTNQIKNKILDSDAGNNKLISGTVQVLSLPFLILESLIFLLKLVAIGFSILPPIVEILILSPLGLLIIFDYVIPTIRGN